MTNSSPQNPQPSEPSSISQEELQRIRRQALNSTMDEWIAVIVAFGTIGAILFWSLGGRKGNFTTLSQSSFLSSSRRTQETKANVNLESQGFASTEIIDDFNITKSSEDAQSEESLSSKSSSIGSLSQNNFNQKNNSFYSLPLTASVPSVTKTVIPKPTPEVVTSESESEPEVVTSEPESEPEVVTSEPESESEVVATEPEIETPAVSEDGTGAVSEDGTDAISEAGTGVGSEAGANAISEAGTGVIAFSDVSEQYWAYPFISKLEAEKLIPDSSSFKPDEPITRASMASLISHAFKDSPSIQATKNFKDVSSDNKNVIADINKAVAIGFMHGYSDENFSPDQNIPRYQVLVALATGLKLQPSDNANTILQNFSDNQELPQWSLEQVAAATEAGLAINRPDFNLTSLKPNEPATRAEVAAMIYQTLAKLGKVPQIESQYIVAIP